MTARVVPSTLNLKNLFCPNHTSMFNALSHGETNSSGPVRAAQEGADAERLGHASVAVHRQDFPPSLLLGHER
ncbi:hypothetical protein, partial [Deinococcus sp.]|uniref:hypothetical protein n=1 Tax=Deinococcus sp. TaxID=47478 RepID=UPI00286E4048